MFLGVSKNVGNGFRIGVGTKIGGGKSPKPSNKKLRSDEFSTFMLKVQTDMNSGLLAFIENNGQNFKQLQKSKADLDEVFADNEKYKEFMSIYNQAREDIDKVLYTADDGIIAKRSITDAVFNVKNFISREYPNYQVRTENVIWKSIKSVVKVVGYSILALVVLSIVMAITK